MKSHSGTMLFAAMLLVFGACAPDRTDEPERPVDVHLDGAFEDFADAVVLVDEPHTPGAPLGIGAVRAVDDPAWLYLSFETARPVNAQAMDGTLRMLVDADRNSATGTEIDGLTGVDFALDLSRMDRPQAGGYGAGFGLREVGREGLEGYRSAYELDVVAAPTFASTRFELRIARGGTPDGFARLGDTMRLRFVFERDGRVLESSPAATYAFRTSPGSDPFEPDLAPMVRPAEASVRVAAWNVSDGSFRTPGDFARLLAAVEPDVILLDEVFGNVTVDFLTEFFASEPLAALGTWAFVLGESGGRQKTVVAARDRSIRPVERMRRILYAPEAIENLRGVTPESFHRLLGFEEERHIASTGAWVDVDGTDVLFVPLDLESGGWAGGPDDLLRDLQASTIRRHVLVEIGEPGPDRAPVVVGGDFNLVGRRSPLDTLARGLDTNGAPLVAADAPRLGQRSDATWQDLRSGPFGPGRLDFVLFSPASLEQVGGFVFDTEDLTDAQLATLGLERTLSSTTSDHRIVTVDLRRR